MHLIHIQELASGDLDLRLEMHAGEIPPYAILSHRWGAPSDEVTFRDLVDISSVKQKKGYQKVMACCAQALEYGLSYAWIDTCCIDKSSSAELSEAINSMYSWYKGSRVCFAYLEDVLSDENPLEIDSPFQRSVWFTRGWTLQELIAPVEVIFFDSRWSTKIIGSKSSLADLISKITGVQKHILMDREKIHTASVAQKMSWASRRQTTRVEDEAYSLLGIFGVSLATIYGEGRRAFQRLQEEIMKTSSDHTIFAWQGQVEPNGMLATSPRSFADSAGYKSLNYNDFIDRFDINKESLKPYYTLTNFGLQIQLPIVSMWPHFKGYHFAFLAASHGADAQSVIIFLRQRHDRPPGHFSRVQVNGHTVIHRRIPHGGYLQCAPASRVIISGSEPQGLTNISSSVSENPRNSCAYLRTRISVTEGLYSASGLLRMDRFVSNNFTLGLPGEFRQSIFIYPPVYLPEQTMKLCEGQSLILEFCVGDFQLGCKTLGTVAFGMHLGEPWTSANLHWGYDQNETSSDKTKHKDVDEKLTYEPFTGVSIWQRDPSRIILPRQDALKKRKDAWVLGTWFDYLKEFRFDVSLEHASVPGQPFSNWVLDVNISRLYGPSRENLIELA